jgi:hypothetical protein
MASRPDGAQTGSDQPLPTGTQAAIDIAEEFNGSLGGTKTLDKPEAFTQSRCDVSPDSRQ